MSSSEREVAGVGHLFEEMFEGQLIAMRNVRAVLLLSMVMNGKGKPKRIEGDSTCDQFQQPWLSTPKYPKGSDNGKDDEGYLAPIKKLHSMKNYEESSKKKKK
jgi:hypothetical protein